MQGVKPRTEVPCIKIKQERRETHLFTEAVYLERVPPLYKHTLASWRIFPIHSWFESRRCPGPSDKVDNDHYLQKPKPNSHPFYRLFAVKRCARCQRGIFANELVMRARDLVYHLHCFTCAWCNTALTQGDYFGLRDNLVYCRAHYELMTHGEPPPHHSEQLPAHLLPRYPGGMTLLPPHPHPVDAPFAPFPGVTGTVRKGRPRKRKTQDAVAREGLLSQTLMLESADGCNLHLSSLDSGGGHHPHQGGGSAGGGQQRTKRMRTSFKHHQLRTMKSYFAINQNPDAKDLKQLAQKTGLSKRVLQVWFQNARAKWRRNNLRGVDHPQAGGGQNSQPTPHSQNPHSPGATSSFSEHSPQQPTQGAADYEAMAGMPRPQGGAESLPPLTSFQELF
ncbi:hypothetical protein JTE90_017897 [Oedothorax gibbosus]|uniref:Apterous n=1 Tax=Oedothorax gibbosus TaxID=931172 RepID=A0AAV6VG57_9ARAC|nr:hypothetical protein JTE90_017897 [Oedothorax gibbosus]